MVPGSQPAGTLPRLVDRRTGDRRAGVGRIVNLASFAGQQGGTVAGAHDAASKAGILVLTRSCPRSLPTGRNRERGRPGGDPRPGDGHDAGRATRCARAHDPRRPVRRDAGGRCAVRVPVLERCRDITGAALDINGAGCAALAGLRPPVRPTTPRRRGCSPTRADRERGARPSWRCSGSRALTSAEAAKGGRGARGRRSTRRSRPWRPGFSSSIGGGVRQYIGVEPRRRRAGGRPSGA